MLWHVFPMQMRSLQYSPVSQDKPQSAGHKLFDQTSEMGQLSELFLSQSCNRCDTPRQAVDWSGQQMSENHHVVKEQGSGRDTKKGHAR